MLSMWDGKKYQIPNARVIERYKYVKKHASLFDGLKVLDLGCNAGLFALPLIDHVEHYIGIESEPKYYNQAVMTKKVLGEKMTVLKVRIGDVDFETMDCNALIVSRVLYYLDDETIERIRTQLLPKCKVVLLINGTRPKKKKSNSWDFWKRESATTFLERFNREYEPGAEGASYRIIAERQGV